MEEFGFHSVESSQKQCRFLSNQIPELRLFVKWFLEQNKPVISFLEEAAIDLPSLIGPEFYKNRIQEADPSYLRRKQFLEKLGIQSEPNLSVAELDTVKLILRGYTAPQIATKLDRSKRTIEHRIEGIKAKLQCLSKGELIQKVQDLGHFGY